MALPTLTAEQRAEALKKAQAARVARKRLLDQVKAGELTVAQVLSRRDSDPVVAKTKVSALVQAVPGCGVVRAAAVPAEAKIADGRRVGGLGAKQHDALLSALT